MSKNYSPCVDLIVGGQFGSEGKGVIVNHIADNYLAHVRVGAPNAGHTFFHNGRKIVMQTIPCGWTNPNALVFIGKGGLVEPELLIKELDMLYEIDPTILSRIRIDSDAGIISDWHKEEEGGVHGEMHARIGSTGKGVGASRRDRLMRNPDKFKFVKDIYLSVESAKGYGWSLSHMLDDTEKTLNKMVSDGMSILIEGAQGAGLSLIHGYYPYVTSTDTNASAMLSDVGISPLATRDIILVFRTYPIRVAGNSGYMYEETSWEELSQKLGRDVTEKTTVTKKTRRIGKWDENLFIKSCRINRPTKLAVTFLDYLEPTDEGKTDYDSLSTTSKIFLKYCEVMSGAKVSYAGTGGETYSVVDVP